MKQTVIVITLLFMAILTSCDDKGNLSWPVGDDSKSEFEELHSMVYIDVSLSRDSTSVLNAISKMEKIFLAQPNDITCRFIVKVIDSDKSVSALFDDLTKPLPDTRYKTINEFRENREKHVKEMRESILNYYKNVAPYKESSKQSCICNSLENTNGYFKQLDTKKCKTQLIVFSDMYEECKKKASNFDEDFCTCNGEYKRRKSLKQLLEIVKSSTPKHSLKKYVKAENLYFILDENDQYNESNDFCLKTQEIETLWEEILKKMGYSKHELKDITFDQSVPDRLLETAE